MHYTALMKRESDRGSAADGDAAFLADLGTRVRDARSRIGLSRKRLAIAAGVSERFLAQLESGSGNGSILLLRSLARTLGVELATLVGSEPEGSAEDGRARKRSGRIALIGLRGAGKSTLGAGLAQRRGVPFIELDREIERESGLGLGEIFAISGAAGFRRLERRCLDRILEEHERFVLATGGSIASEDETFERLRGTCFTVWLRALPEEHMARVIAQGDLRPMGDNAEAMDDLRAILAGREAAYALADARLDTSGTSVDASLDALASIVDPAV